MLFSLFRREQRGVETEQGNMLLALLEMVSLSPVLDRWFQSLCGTGDSFVASARAHIDSTRLPLCPKMTRCLRILPIEVNIFSWRMAINLLPSQLFLYRRRMEIPSLHCPICAIGTDSVNHSFFSCTFALEIQERILLWWEIDIPLLFCYEQWLFWLSALCISSLQRLFLEVVFVVSW